MTGGSVEETSSQCVIGVPLYAGTAPSRPADARARAPPLPRQVLSNTTNTGTNTDRIRRVLNNKLCKAVLDAIGLVLSVLLLLSPVLFVGSTVLYLLSVFNTSPFKFGVYSLSVSGFNISGSGEVTANWEVGFLARNPNPAVYLSGRSYENAIVSVYYKNHLLSEAVFPKISFLSKKTKSYTGNAVAWSKRIDDSQVAEAIARDWSQGVVAFTINLRLKSDDCNHYKLEFTCNDIKVEFSDHSSIHGTMMVGPQDSAKHTDEQAFSRCS